MRTREELHFALRALDQMQEDAEKSREDGLESIEGLSITSIFAAIIASKGVLSWALRDSSNQSSRDFSEYVASYVNSVSRRN
tara:strand:- start:777 stop:1022 length:246 start_codon:yes stop_codon:yes gene_type:complete